MTYHFNGVLQRILPDKGQFAYRQRQIIVGGVCFTLDINTLSLSEGIKEGRKYIVIFKIKTIHDKIHENRYFNLLMVTSLTEM